MTFDKINLNFKTLSMVMITIAIVMLLFENNQNPQVKMNNNVYKILTHNQWNDSKNGYIITELDLKDGFVHLSTASQLSGTLHYYFYEFYSLILLQFKSNDIADNLVYENPIPETVRKGKFPHYYSKLNIDKISNFWEIKRGSFSLPEEVILDEQN